MCFSSIPSTVSDPVSVCVKSDLHTSIALMTHRKYYLHCSITCLYFTPQYHEIQRIPKDVAYNQLIL